MSDTSSSTDRFEALGARLGIWGGVEVPTASFAAPFEDLIMVYSVGHATLSPDHRYISLEGEVFQTDQTRSGRWSGIWELKVGLEDARKAPPTAPGAVNRPVGRVATTPANGFNKERWDFGDGSSITLAGAGIVHTTTTSKVQNVIWLSGNQVPSFGTGRFEGVNGTKTAAVGIFLPANVSFADAPSRLEMRSLDIFRLYPKDVIGPPPQLPTDQAG